MSLRVRPAFTLIEVLIVLAIVLVLASVGIGASLKAMDWRLRSNSEVTIRKVSERLERRHDEILKHARDWPTPPAIYRQAGGSAKRAEVLKLKYLLKWSFPQNYAEVLAGIAESKAVGYGQDGYPFLVAVQQRLISNLPPSPLPLVPHYWLIQSNRGPILAALGITLAEDLRNQNAVLLFAIFSATFGSSSGELAPSDFGHYPAAPAGGGYDSNPMIMDAWGTPLQFLRNGAPGMPVATMTAASPWDADDPDELLRGDPSASRSDWWAANGSWFIATFGYDPNVGYWPRVIISAGADKNFIGIEDNLDSGRMQLRVGHQQ